MTPTTIHCERVTVTFGETIAVRDVSVTFAPGKIHALVGQNGAGKTTLARVIAGLTEPQSGSVTMGTTLLPAGDVTAARNHGIEMVHQSFALPPTMTVAEGLEYGSTARAGRAFSRRSLVRRWQTYLDEIGADLDASARISRLPVESAQALEIARALSADATILILDEPTAVLSPEGIGRLFERLRALRARGVTVIVVLHKVREVLDIADTVTVLRGGQLVLDTTDAEGLSPTALAEAVVGTGDGIPDADIDAALGVHIAGRRATTASHERPLLRLAGVSSPTRSGGAGLGDIDFQVAPHEIVGVAGVEGNGQVALAETIIGLTRTRGGVIEIEGRDVTSTPTLGRRALGLRVIPFDRNTEGLSTTTSLWGNWAIPQIAGSGRRLFSPVPLERFRRAAESSFREWDVRFSSVNQSAGSLSGGNAQKVILARELDSGARVIVAAQPTRGLDLGAVEVVWTALRRARDDGAAVTVISSDLDELMEISDRIVVMLAGGIALSTSRPFDRAAIGAAMTGAGS